MANRFFEAGSRRGAQVNALFNQIAPRYDLINDLQSFGLHRYWKRRLVELSAIKPGAAVLDVCCGTGDLALAMAGKGAKVAAVDFSEPMLKVAIRRAGAGHPQPGRTAPGAEFIRADALKIPFADSSFEIVSVGYGLRNLSDWQAGLAEMLRVSKPGGRVLVLDFGKPPNALWRQLYFGYLRLFVPVLGRVFAGSWSAYAYILESLKHYPAQKGVAAKMRSMGLAEVRIVNLLAGAMSINYGEKPHG